MHTVLEVIQKTTDFLSGKGIENPRLNAELLIGHALGLKRMQLYVQFERLLTEPDLEKIRPLVRRRGQREPVQYIFGETEFCGLKLKTDRRALIPRPETEYLVELVIERVKVLPTSPGRILDLGTGTGALALALAAQIPAAQVTAVDTSSEALSLARENAVATGLVDRVTFVQSDWFSSLSAEVRYDLIAGNPPYLSAEETAAAQPEVRAHEPHGALTAEENGLAALRRIIADAPRFLAPGGLIALETGIAQHATLLELIGLAGLTAAESCQDLAKRDRYVFARSPL